MATPKNRYIIFKIITSTNRPVKMTTDSFLNILKDRLYRDYGIFGLISFDDIFVTLFLPYKQLVILKSPREMKRKIVDCLKEFREIKSIKIKFMSLMVKSSIKRLQKYLKKEHVNEEHINEEDIE
ncbi:putative Ribonuclease P/MRP protein subunit protein [Pseudoloma neurophilia]|uniref:Ribonuclease P/MRP protein subunit POP5 n=1 Tax=Pseudoloma neurophilia TaxID=146866 RepID=A0A0R0LQR4_9MICR|nr:putative Ribonuclease P/MRP protein subunit protein [Pseudoloma neurophilia]